MGRLQLAPIPPLLEGISKDALYVNTSGTWEGFRGIAIAKPQAPGRDVARIVQDPRWPLPPNGGRGVIFPWDAVFQLQVGLQKHLHPSHPRYASDDLNGIRGHGIVRLALFDNPEVCAFVADVREILEKIGLKIEDDGQND